MSDRIEATIIARDQASKVFEKVGDSAEKMGDEITASAKESGRSLKQLEEDARAIGLGIGALIGTLSVAGQSFRDQEIALNTMRRSYGDAATDIEEFSRALAESSNFSEEAIVSAANVAATLVRNYGATAQEVQQILQISADLAATSGFAYEDATQRVVAALRGEAEAAEQLGLTMNQQAIDRENLTLSMSNQEAFQFRLNALTEQSAFAMGAAAEQADTTYGSMVNLEGIVRDTGQSVADSLGPLGEMGAYLADNAVQSALFGASMMTMGRGALTAAQLIGTGGLVGALGAAGLVGALVLADAALDEMSGNLESSTVALERMDVAAADLDETVRQLFATGNQLAYLGEQGLNLFPGIQQDIENMSNLESQIAVLQASGGPQNDQQREMLQGWESDLEALITKYGELDSAQLESTEYATLFADAQESFNEILTRSTIGAADAQEALRGVVDAFVAGNLTAPQFAETVVLLAGGLQNYDKVATDSAAATSELAAAQKAAAESGGYWFIAQSQLNHAMAEYAGLGQSVMDTWAPHFYDTAEAAEAANAQLEIAAGNWNAVSVEAARAQAAVDATNNQLSIVAGNWNVMSVEAASAMHDTAEAVDYLNGVLEQTFENVRSEFTATTDALNAGFGAAVGNTNAIASQSESVNDWAMELVNVRGVLGEIDEIYQMGTPQWEAAQLAQESIAASNERIQRSILKIQSDQIPVIAELLNTQEDYWQGVASGTQQEQMLALAYADSATSAQALSLAQAAIADMDTFGPMLVQAAELNPYLASILEDIGLITQQDGEITLTADAEGAQSEIELLTHALNTLNETIYTAFIDGDKSGAQEAFDAANTWFSSWDGSVATARIEVEDAASSVIALANAGLALFDGWHATATVTTNYVSNGTRPGFVAGMHGGVMGYADGGVVARMGEVMPEMLTSPNGKKSLALTDGLYGVPQGTYVTPGPATAGITGNFGGVTVNVNIENLYGDETLAEKVSAEIVPAIQRAMAIHERGY